MSTFLYAADRKGVSAAYTHRVNWIGLREVLRQQRAATGESLDRLAARTGVNRATIHSIENVKREPKLKPKIETIEKLGTALGLQMSDIFRRVESVPAGKDSAKVSVSVGGGAHGESPVLETLTNTDIESLNTFSHLFKAAAVAAREIHEHRHSVRAIGKRKSKVR